MRFLFPFKTVFFSLFIVVSSCKKKELNPIQIPAVEDPTIITIHVIDDNGGNPISGAEVTLYEGVATIETGYQDVDMTNWVEESNPIAFGISDANGEVVFNNITIDSDVDFMDYYCDVQHKNTSRSNWRIDGHNNNIENQDVVRVKKNKETENYIVINYYPQNIMAKTGGRTWVVDKMHYPLVNIDSNDVCYLDNTFVFYKSGMMTQNEGLDNCAGIENSYETYFIYSDVQPFGIRFGVNGGQPLSVVYMTKDSMRLINNNMDNWIKLVRVD